MAIVEAVQCPAGHAQKFARPDRLGRCTRCGAALITVPHDNSLPQGFQQKGGRIVDETGDTVPIDVIEEEEN